MMKYTIFLLLFLISASAFADRCGIRNPSDTSQVKLSKRDDCYVPEAIDPIFSGWEYFKEIFNPVPTAGTDYDPATQKYIPDVVETAGAGTFADPVIITHDWSIVPLSQAEQDAIADNASRDALRPVLAGYIATLRTWAADASSTTVTSGNNTVVTQTVVTRFGLVCDRLADLLENQRYDK